MCIDHLSEPQHHENEDEREKDKEEQEGDTIVDGGRKQKKGKIGRKEKKVGKEGEKERRKEEREKEFIPPAVLPQFNYSVNMEEWKTTMELLSSMNRLNFYYSLLKK